MTNYLTQNSSGDFTNTFSNIEQDLNTISPNATANTNVGGIFAFAAVFWVIIIAIAIVDTILKAKAMWRAARMSEKGWFICLFLFNTAGILPLIYLSSTKAKYRETILKKFSN